MPKVVDLNPTLWWGGTDLGIPVAFVDSDRVERVMYFFGDTFGGTQPWGPPKPVGNWRSPCAAVANRRPSVSTPIMFSRACRNGEQLFDYEHDNAEFNTVLPTDGVQIGATIYLWTMYTKDLGNERWCQVHWSDDFGESWQTDGRRWPTNAYGGKRVMLTWELGADGYLYIMTTGGLARDKNLMLWRTLADHDHLLAVDRWEPWGWDGRRWAWGIVPTSDPRRGLLQDGYMLGEIHLSRYGRGWVLSGFDRGALNMFVKIGGTDLAATNWWTAPDFRPIKHSQEQNGGPDIVSQLYGCYLMPEGIDGAIVSQWKTSTGDPYRAMQYQLQGVAWPRKPWWQIWNRKKEN